MEYIRTLKEGERVCSFRNNAQKGGGAGRQDDGEWRQQREKERGLLSLIPKQKKRDGRLRGKRGSGMRDPLHAATATQAGRLSAPKPERPTH